MILEKEVIFIQKLAYSFHIGNDKNKSKRSRKNIKNGVVADKVFNNNAIQNAQIVIYRGDYFYNFSFYY